jgi:hypothetical protein
MWGYVQGAGEGCYNLESEVARNKIMVTLEQELIEKISHLDDDKKRQVLEFVETIIPKFYTLDELSAMPPEERRKAVAASFAAAANEDFEIFEASSEEDFDDYTQS